MDIPIDPALQPNPKSLRRREADPTERNIAGETEFAEVAEVDNLVG